MHNAPYAGYPQPYQDPFQAQKDVSNLNTLAVCHYIYGGFQIFVGFFAVIYVIIGAVMASEADPSRPGSPPIEVGIIFMGIGALVMLMLWTIGAFTIYAGRCLARRRRHVLCIVVAGFNCMHIPLGLLLGIFSIMTLSRQSVKDLFAQNAT